jgi:hypothetical protein
LGPVPHPQARIEGSGVTPAEDGSPTPSRFFSRTDLRELGYERRAIDAMFRSSSVIVLPGYSRPLIRVADYNAFLERCTYHGRERVR